jgi:hypothetical protein
MDAKKIFLIRVGDNAIEVRSSSNPLKLKVSKFTIKAQKDALGSVKGKVFKQKSYVGGRVLGYMRMVTYNLYFGHPLTMDACRELEPYEIEHTIGRAYWRKANLILRGEVT